MDALNDDDNNSELSLSFSDDSFISDRNSVINNCIINNIEQNDLQSVLHCFAYHDVNFNDMNDYMAAALYTNNYIILSILAIYKEQQADAPNMISYGAKYNSINIESAIIAQNMNELIQTSLLSIATESSNIACFKLLKPAEEPDGIVIDACDDGHMNWVSLLSDPNNYKVNIGNIKHGYINVAKWCVNNNAYISIGNCRYFDTINDAIILLLDNNLIDYRIFTKNALIELKKRGYVIPN